MKNNILWQTQSLTKNESKKQWADNEARIFIFYHSIIHMLYSAYVSEKIIKIELYMQKIIKNNRLFNSWIRE